MSAALWGGDDVHVAAEHGLIPGAPTQGDIDLALALKLGGDHVALVVEHGNGLVKRAGAGHSPGLSKGSVRGEEVDVFGDATIEAKQFMDGLHAALVGDVDAEASHQERGLTRAGREFIRLKGRAAAEYLRIRPVANPGTGDTARHPADHAQFTLLLEGGEHGVRSRSVRGIGEGAGLPPME